MKKWIAILFCTLCGCCKKEPVPVVISNLHFKVNSDILSAMKFCAEKNEGFFSYRHYDFRMIDDGDEYEIRCQ